MAEGVGPAETDITAPDRPGGVEVALDQPATTPPPEEPRPPALWLRIAALAVPAIMAVGVGLWGLTLTSIDRDETATVDISSRTLPQIFHMLRHFDAVHGLYYLIIHFWTSVFGTTPASVRTPSLIAAGLGASMLVVLGTRLVSYRAGFVAGLLYAGAPMISMYAHDARSYTLDSLFVILATYLFVRGLAGGGRRIWVGYGAAVVFMVGLHLFTILVLPAHAVTAAWHARRQRDWRGTRLWTVTVAGALVVLTPLFVLSLRQASLLNWVSPPSVHSVKQFFVNTSGGLWLVAPMFLLAALAFRANRPDPVTPSVPQVAWPWLVLPPVLLMGYSLHHPLYVYRYVLYCLPALLLLVATTLDSLRWRRWHLGIPVGVALLVAMIPAQIGVRDAAYGANDTKGEAALIAAHKQPRDAILFLVPVQRYFINSYPSAYAGLDDVLMKRSQADTGTFSGTNVNDATLLARLRQVNRVWAVRYWDWPSHRAGDRRLAKHRYAQLHAAGLKWVSSTHFRGGEILLFARPGTG